MEEEQYVCSTGCKKNNLPLALSSYHWNNQLQKNISLLESIS